jgi:hypothetical protein
MQWQLRDYAVREGLLDSFVEAFVETIVPQRLEAGFVVPMAVLNRSTGRFVWVQGYPGPEGLLEFDDAYYNSPSRRTHDPDPAGLVERADKELVERIL